MGQNICQQTPQDNDLSMDPLSSVFKQTPPFVIPDKLNQLLNKIKTLREEITDPRQNHSLKYYHSVKYGFGLLGQIKSKRPVGECLFYFHYDDTQKTQLNQQKEINKQTLPNYQQQHLLKKHPILITTYITPHYTFSSQTLIIYQDFSYYIGQIMAKKYQVPKANGQGLLVTKDFIYEGEFQDGFPEGYGQYRTKSLQFTGYIKKGMPCGECIQKTSKGMFMGRIDQKTKVGFLITPQNKRIEIHQSISNYQQLNI